LFLLPEAQPQGWRRRGQRRAGTPIRRSPRDRADAERQVELSARSSTQSSQSRLRSRHHAWPAGTAEPAT